MTEAALTAVREDVTTPAILLVEDNPDDVILVRRALQRIGLGAHLIVVEHGEAAIDYLSGHGGYADRIRYPLPDVVLLDLKLPRRSGHEVLQWVRERAAFDSTPVVIMTSSAEEQDVSKAYQGRANSYLRKPIAFSELLAMLQLLGRYWLETNVAPTPGRAFQ